MTISHVEYPCTSQTRENAALEVVVLHTTTQATLRSLRTAAELASGLAARIRLLVLEIVPYPLDVETPDVPVEFSQKHFRTIAAKARVDTVIDLRLGRDRRQMIESSLKPGSLVVLNRSPWWTSESRLARRLKSLGHHVLFAA